MRPDTAKVTSLGPVFVAASMVPLLKVKLALSAFAAVTAPLNVTLTLVVLIALNLWFFLPI